MTRAALVLVLACGGDPAPDCTCKPAHAPSDKQLDLLRRHRDAVRAGQRNGRDTKLVDDELRVQAQILCEPCSAWVGARATPDELYPLHRLDDATAATCLGLVLRDGTVAYGGARTCR
jgi:hypothetical protein